MKKGKDKEPKPEVKINFDISWQKLSQLETSLRKALNKFNSLELSQEYIEILIQSSKKILQSVAVLKNEQKHYQTIQDNYNLSQSKLNNHDKIVSDLQKNYRQRMKTMSEEAKIAKEHYEKAKRTFMESEQQAKNLAAEMKKQNSELKYKVQILSKEKEELLEFIEEKDKQIKKTDDQLKKLRNVLVSTEEEKPASSSLEDLICSRVGSRILSYLTPVEICELEILSKHIKIYLTKTKSCSSSLSKSLLGIKDRNIRYYHKHIQYFEKLYHKIPEQILQVTFYQYQIAKQQIGTEILSILNSSALLFEGKFTDMDEEINVIESILKQEDLEQIAEQNILEVDENIVKEFYQDKANKKQKINKEINLMYKKIQDTSQLYSADVESFGLFMKNVLKNFAKVFVLGKNLYTEARNLQSLNTFLLSELSTWDRSQVHKNSIIEDQKAELEAQRKLKIFFTQKSQKSEQRALNQQNVKLSMQVKYNKQIQKLDQICRQREQLKDQVQSLQQNLKAIQNENRQVRKAYEAGRDKYNKIIQELGVVKETILRMNIM